MNEPKLKKIFLLSHDCSDGSSSIRFVMEQSLIDAMHKADEIGLLDCEKHSGVDGDGFHYTSINVPEDFTPEILGISKYAIITPENFFASIASEELSNEFSNLNSKIKP